MLLKEAAVLFVDSLEGYAEETRSNYETRVLTGKNSFIFYCMNEGVSDFSQITYPFVEKFKKYLETFFCGMTVCGFITALRSFLNFSNIKGWSSINGKELHLPKKTHRKIERPRVPPEVIDNVIRTTMGHNTFSISRNSFITVAFGKLGLEPNELAKIKICDIKPCDTTARIEVYSRCNIKKSIILDPESWKRLLQYLKERSSYLHVKRAPDPGFLIISYNGKAIGVAGIQAVIHRIKDAMILSGATDGAVELNPSTLRKNARVLRADGVYSSRQVFYVERRWEHMLDSTIAVEVEPFGTFSTMEKICDIMKAWVNHEKKFWWAVYPSIVDDPTGGRLVPCFYGQDTNKINEEPLTLYMFKERAVHISDRIEPISFRPSRIGSDHKLPKKPKTMRERVRAIRLLREV
jgi:hypothetical protein